MRLLTLLLLLAGACRCGARTPGLVEVSAAVDVRLAPSEFVRTVHFVGEDELAVACDDGIHRGQAVVRFLHLPDGAETRPPIAFEGEAGSFTKAASLEAWVEPFRSAGVPQPTVLRSEESGLDERLPGCGHCQPAFSPDGTLVATPGGVDRSSRAALHRLADLQPVCDFTDALNTAEPPVRLPADHGTRYLRFSPDGSLIGVIRSDGQALLFRTTDCALAANLGRVNHGNVALAFSPDGARVAIAGEDKGATVYEVSGAQVSRYRPSYDNAVRGAVAWAGARLFAFGPDASVVELDPMLGTVRGFLPGSTEIPLPPSGVPKQAFAWATGLVASPAGRWLVAPRDGELRVWDLRPSR